MKKIFIAFLCMALILSMCACSGGNEEVSEKIPPAFTVLQNKMKMTKYSEKGSAASFSEQEFVDFLGEEFDYITVNTLPENGNLLCNGKSVLKGQTIPASDLNYLKYVPNGDSAYGFFGFNGDNMTNQANEIFCEIVFKSGENSPPVVADGVLQTVEGISCGGKLSITEPNGDSYTVNIITYPSDGFLDMDEAGNFIYTPHEGFSGGDKIVYTVTDCFGSVSSAATHKILVEENTSGIVFADMEENEAHLYAHRMCEKNVMVYRSEDGNYYFDPETPVSKMDFLVMLMCVTGLDKDITAVADSIIDDDTGLSSGLKGYLSAAYDMGLLDLQNGKFAPKENITSNDAAYMMANALKLPGAVDAIASEKEDVLLSIGISAGLFDSDTEHSSVLTKSLAAKLLCRVEDYMVDNNIQNN